jgi:hypothetical protein
MCSAFLQIIYLLFHLLVPEHWMNHNIFFLDIVMEVTEVTEATPSHANL